MRSAARELQRRDGAAHRAIGVELDARFHQARRAKRHLSGTLKDSRIRAVLSLLSWTSGSSKGSMAIEAPAKPWPFPFEEFGAQLQWRPSAESPRQARPAASVRAVWLPTRTGRHLRGTERRDTAPRQHVERRATPPATGTIPRSSLPVLSAMSCSIQSPSGVNAGVESKTSLSSPLRAAAPSKDPSCNAGLASARVQRTTGSTHFDGAVQDRANVDSPKRAQAPAQSRRAAE